MWPPGLEGEFGGEWIHVYVWLSPFTVHLKPSQHCSLTGYTPIQNKKLKKKKKRSQSQKRQILHLYELPGVDKIRDQG